jgi:hypothetical protein
MTAKVGFCDPAIGPNAEVRWASDWFPSNAKWLNMTLNELYDMYSHTKSGLAFEVIALKDIYANEEVSLSFFFFWVIAISWVFTHFLQIFIDYGYSWERACNSHVRSWRPPAMDNGFRYESVTSFLDKSVRPRTIYELTTDPYPENIIQVCYFDTNIAETYGSEGTGYDLIIEDGSIFSPAQFLLYEDYVYPCDLLRRDDEATCVVVVRPFSDNDKTVMIKRYPLATITFRPKPYSSDQHLGNAFRHYIPIKDDIFPAKWKNRSRYSNNAPSSDECTLVLAPSSIPNAGFGIFSTKVIMPGQSIVVEDAPSIIVTDSIAHNNRSDINWSLIDYSWGGESDSDSFILSFNVGALANFHLVSFCR